MSFKHEKLYTYQEALDFLEWTTRTLVPAIRKHDPDLADQVRRASSSIAMNLSEGSSRRTSKDRMRFFAIALGSAAECATVFDIVERLGYFDSDDFAFETERDRLRNIGQWIRNLVRSIERRTKGR